MPGASATCTVSSPWAAGRWPPLPLSRHTSRTWARTAASGCWRGGTSLPLPLRATGSTTSRPTSASRSWAFRPLSSTPGAAT
eukprot:8601883-Pyramimonas_sp.AAC.1